MTDVLRRRNGRPQACDPCRKRKVSCDHAQPVCHRCRRRNQADECVYTLSSHSAPGSASLRKSRPTPRRPSSASSTALAELTQRWDDEVQPTTTDQRSHHGVPKPTSVSPASSLAPRPPGYLGFTSYSAVYEETSNSLSRLQGIPSLSVLPPEKDARGTIPGILSSPTREMAMTVLRTLPFLEDLDIPPRKSPDPSDGWTRGAGRRILKSCQALLGSDRSESRLEETARMLCVNTAKPVYDDIGGPDKWIGQFAEDNLRWESLGLLFTFINRQTHTGGRKADPGSGWGVTLTGLGLCLDLAKRFSDGNLMLLLISYQRSIFESMVAGDAALSVWRAHAEAVALLTFLGIHAEQDTPVHQATFGSELRRRMFATVFNLDKVSVSFQGRPPLLCHRYVSTPLPLDIPNDDFAAGGEAFQRALGEIGEDGWSTSGELSTATVLRARTMLSFIKDELIEIALSANKTPPLATLLDIKARALATIESFPPTLSFTQSHIEDQSIHVDHIFSRMLIRIEHLQNLFFAERLLLKRVSEYPGADDGNLLLISYEMVALVLMFWIHKDRFAQVSNDFEWLVMCYAAPGGGILCMELLRPTFAGPHHPANSSITRSAIIQQLSLLVGFLGWVSPDAPNADLCASCRLVIQHVLDHTLNNPGGVPLQQGQVQEHPAGDAFGQVPDAENLLFGFDLLDTFDWLRADDFGAPLGSQ